MRGHEGGRGHHAGADREAGGRRARQQGADPEARRPHLRHFRADRAGHCAADGASAGISPPATSIRASFRPLPFWSLPVLARSALRRPTAIMVGTGLGARRGILIKNGEALERGETIDVVLFDKTGTLTEGKPSGDGAACCRRASEEEVLRLAASVEQFSEHPLAQAIVAAAARAQSSPCRADRFREPCRQGRARDGWRRDRSGRQPAAAARRAAFHSARLILPLHRAAESQAQTVVAVARDGRLVGIIAIADTLKGDARAAIDALHAQGIDTVMITGDNEDGRAAIAAPARHRARLRRGAAAGEGRKGARSCRERALASPLSATASTMRRPWRRPISASPWAPAPTSPSRPATSCW